MIPLCVTFKPVTSFTIVNSVFGLLNNPKLTLCPGPFLSKFVELAHNDYTFKKIKPIKASQVAEFGYKKSLKGKSLAIVGFKNRLTICITTPRLLLKLFYHRN